MAMTEINTFMTHGAVNEDAESSERENAAHGLLSRGVSVTEAATIFGRSESAACCDKRTAMWSAHVRSRPQESQA